MKFFHVKQQVDYQTEEIKYAPIMVDLSKEEVDSLVVILDSRRIEYKVCVDNSVLVRKSEFGIYNYRSMAVYDNLLKSKVETDLSEWEYR